VAAIEYAKERGIERCSSRKTRSERTSTSWGELYNAAIAAGASARSSATPWACVTPSTAKWFVREFKKRVKPVQLPGMGTTTSDGGGHTLAALEERRDPPRQPSTGSGAGR